MRHSHPLVVSSDVHLSQRSQPELSRDLARLVRAHPGHEIVLAGDLLDLCGDPPNRDPGDSLLDLVRPHAALVAALRAHLADGHPLTLIAGNHDPPVATPSASAALLDLIGVGRAAPLAITPWFVRRGGTWSAYPRVMRKLLEKIEAMMTAVAFAEEGEVEAARQIMTEAGVGEPGDPHEKPAQPPSSLYTPRVAKASGA